MGEQRHYCLINRNSKGGAEFQWCFKVPLKDRPGELKKGEKRRTGIYGLLKGTELPFNLLGSNRTTDAGSEGSNCSLSSPEEMTSVLAFVNLAVWL